MKQQLKLFGCHCADLNSSKNKSIRPWNFFTRTKKKNINPERYLGGIAGTSGVNFCNRFFN